MIAVMNKNALARRSLCPLVHPVICAFRRVIGADAERSLAAANRGIQHVLISPSPANSSSSSNQTYLKYFPNGSLMDLIFFGSSKPMKNNLLPRPLVDDLHRADGHSPVVTQSQHVNSRTICSKTLRLAMYLRPCAAAYAGILVMLQSRAGEACNQDFMLPRHAAKSALVYSPVLSGKVLEPRQSTAQYSHADGDRWLPAPSGRLVLPISFSRTFSRFAIFSPPFVL